ncbi:MAG: hypothetical protein HUK22_05060, partial [Thermoguttaceae bacterium]|nr:hypothetical protein [Thermoguttaceae bacterium]
RRLHISKATLIAASQLVVLSMIGFLFFHEPITATSFVGLILAALGIAISGFSK